MKRNLLLLTLICLFALFGNAQTTSVTPNGDGTDVLPYKIQNLGNLLWITENPEHWDKHYLQTADIDAAETASWNEGEGWEPIGIDYNNNFSGTYNGGDYTISNLTIIRPASNLQGLFGSAENATIKNIRLVNVNIAGAMTTGAIVGQTQYSTIEKCLSTGTVTGTTYVGGLIGFNNYGNINQCFSSVNVTGTNYIGGITGVHQVDNLLLDSYSTGTLIGGDNVGGLVGTTAVNSLIENSYFAGSISGTSGLGGIVAYRFSASDAFNCFWDTEASGVSTTEVGGDGKTTAEMKNIYTYTSAGWDFKGLGAEGIWNIDPDGYPYLSWINPTNDGPDAPVVANIIANEVTNITGTEATINATITNIGYPTATQYGVCWNTTGEPTTADSKTTLGALSEAGSFTSSLTSLTQNTVYYVRAYAENTEGIAYSNELTFIIATAPTGDGSPETPYQISSLVELYWLAITPSVWDKHFIQTTDIDASETAGWNSGEGWVPIGTSGTPFTGGYNGNYFEIQNITIDRPTVDLQGLFGYTNGANLRCIVTVNAQVAGMNSTGAIVGQAYLSRIENCYSSGNITGSYYVGGIVGFSNKTELLSQCFSNASISGDNTIGGIAGVHQASSKIINSYCVGEISGGDNIGGLVGILTLGGIVENSFFAGTITGNSAVGGLVGSTPNGYVQNSYWDTQTTDLYESEGGTGKTTAEMNNIATFLNGGWDFKGLGAKGIWNIGNDRNNNYPYLSWLYPDDAAISIEILPSAVITDVTSITQTSVTFNIDVTNIGNPQGTQFGVCWSSTNTEPTTSDDNELSTEPFALGNYTIGVVALNHSTTYYARAFATNTNGTAYSEVLVFTTECGAHSLPITENFDNSTSLPLCWAVSGLNNFSVSITNHNRFSTPNSARLNHESSSYVILASPEIAGGLQDLRLRFKALLGDCPSIGNLYVGSMTDPTDASTFTSIQMFEVTNQPGEDWHNFEVWFDEYTGSDTHIAFRLGDGTGSEYVRAFIDDVEIDVIPSCPEPYNLTIGVVTQTTAEISWEAPGVSLFEIAYGPKGFNPQSEGNIISGISSTPHTLTDLDHSTAYEVYIRSTCGTETSGWSYPASFNTECGAHTLPLTENFDNSTSLPLCWAVSGLNNFSVSITNHNRYSTPNSARLYHESSSYAILATPEIAGGIQNLRLRFKALLGYCPSIGNLYVGSMTDPTDASTFTSLKMFEVTNQPGDDWHSFEVWFDEYTGSDTHIAFRLGDGTGSEYVRAFIDDVEIDVIPSCPEPYNLTIGVVTQTTAEISWEAPGVSLFEIAYGPKGFNPQSEGNIISGISSTPHTLTNLDHSTAYEVYIRSTCGTETSGWSYPASFNTECGAHTLPLTENFDNSTSLPLCWAVSGLNNFSVSITNHNRYSTPNSARLYHGSSSYVILATPEIAGGIQNLRLRFKALLGQCPSIGNLYVGSMTNPTDASTFTSIQMFEVTNQPGDEWHSFEVWFDEYTGSDTHIAFRLGDGTGSETVRAFIDNIIIDIIPGCFEPFDLFTDNTTQTTAMVGWTEPATSTQWDIVYGPKGFNPLTQGELVTGVTENPYTLTDLNPSTIYEFYVRTYCDGTPSGWSLPAEFSTDCGPTAVPIIENFDNSSQMPQCWKTLATNSGGTYFLDGYAYSEPNMVYLFMPNTSSTAYLISPEIDADISSLQVSFMAMKYTNDMILEVGTMSDPTNASTFTYISHVQTGVNYQPYSISMVSYTGTDKYIAFKISSNIQEQAGYVFIDDIEIVETHSVTFSVVGTPANGTLTAKVDGIAITSGDYIVNSKAVEFTAAPADGYRVKRWTNNGTTVAGNTTNSYIVPSIQQNISVTVEFEIIPTTYAVTFTVKDMSNNPIKDSQISVGSSVSLTTNSSGEASTSLANGNYTYSVTATGFEEHSGNFSISGENKNIPITLVAVGNNVELLSDVEIYPNPFDQKIVIKGIVGVQHIAITNVAGQLIKNIKIANQTEITIGTGNISAGTYIVTLYFTNGDIQNRKIVKVN